MGGNIASGNARINLLMSYDLKSKIQYYRRKTNRSSNAVVIGILEGAIKKNDKRNYDFKSDPEGSFRKTERMNLVVSSQMKEQLQKEAAESGRSLNNYICSKLLIFFDDIWPDSI